MTLLKDRRVIVVVIVKSSKCTRETSIAAYDRSREKIFSIRIRMRMSYLKSDHKC